MTCWRLQLCLLGLVFIDCAASPPPILSSTLADAQGCREKNSDARGAAPLHTLSLAHGDLYDQRFVSVEPSGRIEVYHRRMANGPGPLFNYRERLCDAALAQKLLHHYAPMLHEQALAVTTPGTPQSADNAALCFKQWTWPDGRKEAPPPPGRCVTDALAATVKDALPLFSPKDAAATCAPGAQHCGLYLESGVAPHPHEQYQRIHDSALLSADGAWRCLRPTGAGGDYELVRGNLPPDQAAAALAWLLKDLTPPTGTDGASPLLNTHSDYQAAWLLGPGGRARLTARQAAIVRQRFALISAQLSAACALRSH
jgi:hypothetical protein